MFAPFNVKDVQGRINYIRETSRMMMEGVE